MKLKVPKYPKAKVLVIGDVMLDSYYYGSAKRISPEAPVPVVKVDQKESRPGGAANVALNISSLGAQCTLIGYVGVDRESTTLMNALTTKNVNCRFVPVQNFPTITKLRVLSRNQQLIRLDFEQGFQEVDPAPLMAVVEECIDDCDVVILSDYGKGVLSQAQSLIKLACKKNKPVLIDPKGTDFDRYTGATLLTPNLSEFEAVAGKTHSEKELATAAYSMLNRYGFDQLLVTRSEQGMSLFTPHEPELHLPTNAREVYDVTGAGDTVIATLGASLAAGVNLKDACRLANVAAGIVVGKLGTSTVSPYELAMALGDHSHAGFGVVTEEELLRLVTAAKAKGERIVMTNGCFDILHAGHCQYLQQAKDLGDRLIVAVNTDESVKRLKGDSRPINTLALRMEVLAALGAVDWVVPFSEDTPQRIISNILPDILVKGGDYKAEEIVGYKEVTSHGGKVQILNFKDGCSTTRVIEQIKSQK